MTRATEPLRFPVMSISSRLVFDVCHEVYQAVVADAEGIPLIDPTKIPSDHLWRSHKAPTGQEYAADFTIACKRAWQDRSMRPDSSSAVCIISTCYPTNKRETTSASGKMSGPTGRMKSGTAREN